MSLTLRHRKYVQRRRKDIDSRLSANAFHPPNRSAHVYLEYVSHPSQCILRTWYFVHRIDRSPLQGNYSLGASHWSVAFKSPTDDTSGIHTGTVPNTTTKDRPSLFSGGNPSSLSFFFFSFIFFLFLLEVWVVHLLHPDHAAVRPRHTNVWGLHVLEEGG